MSVEQPIAAGPSEDRQLPVVPRLVVTSHEQEEATAGNAERKPLQQQQQQEAAADREDQQGEQSSPGTMQRNKAQPLEQMEHFNRIREHVKKAIAAKHTFMIHGRTRYLRDLLVNRGWCEKIQRKNGNSVGEQQIGVDSHPSTLLAGVGNLSDRQNQRVLISKMLSNHTVDFLWNTGSEWSGWPSHDNKNTIFNRFTRANFTSKVGLCSNVRQMHWYYEAGIANTLFPRCYNISLPDQMHAFIEDFRLTACMSLLKWLVDKTKVGGEEVVRSSGGAVPLRALEFAIARCSDLIGSKSHEDIDQELEKVWSHQWDQFITWYYKIIHGNALFIANSVPMNKYILASRHLLKKVKKFWPQLDMDGIMNIWILKPGNKSRGRGIVLMNKVDDILAKVNPINKTTDVRFVIQKYIERPLLIYETKFDIRQWFIVTNAQPLTLWMYRESYLRFCSQKFSLTDFHESIHLSNNAVQCKYKNGEDRDPALPSENMWDVATFKQYLKSRGDEDAWDELIYPGLKQGLVGSMLASQEAMDRRKNSFELYGADFMVMEDFSVWLIEINSHPDMSNSTSVTTRLVRQVTEDILKVVIDYRENSNADTGGFELVYKQKVSNCQTYLGSGLSLHGTRILLGQKSGEKVSPVNYNSYTAALGKRKAAALTTTAAPPPTGTSPRMGSAMVDLIEELELQLDNEFYEYFKLRSAPPISGKLSRQRLPQPSPDQLNNNNNDGSGGGGGNKHLDVETNTRHFNLHLASSETAIKTPITSPNVPGKPLKTGNAKSLASKKSPAKSKSPTLAQAKNAEAINTASAAKTIMSKIIDVRKETVKSKSAAASSRLYRVIKAPENLNDLRNKKKQVLSNKLADVANNNNNSSSGNNNSNNNGSAVKGQKTATIKDEPRPVGTKIIPLIPSGLILSGKKKEKKPSTARPAAPDPAKSNNAKRKDRALNGKIMVDVSDMYAIGLAVNK